MDKIVLILIEIGFFKNNGIDYMEKNLDKKKVIVNAKEISDNYKICDNCLGRLFRRIDINISNEKKGNIIRKKIDKSKTETKDCDVCKGLLDEIDHFVDLILDSLKDYEYETFLIGTKVDEEIIEKEQKINESIKSEESENIKSELNRKIGLILEEKLGKEVDFEKPTIMAVLDTQFDVVTLQILSLFIYGRYKKFSRNIPQTKWFCKVCRGKGCRKCNYSGKLYDNSVEELISKKFLEETKSEDESFHGAGREDIDVKMLGNGRPFVLELKNPKKRNINLEKLKKEINTENKGLIEITNLYFTNREKIAKIKEKKYKKTYKVVFECRNPINKEKLKKAVQSLRGKIIKQKTPSRVAHRRADKVRERKIYNCKVDLLEGTIATLILEAESGTYIKELIHGDDGQTNPNISHLIDAPCIVKKLDVINLKGEE